MPFTLVNPESLGAPSGYANGLLANANGKLGQGLAASGATQNIGDVNGEMGAALIDTLLE
jgi:hypothetical protein